MEHTPGPWRVGYANGANASDIRSATDDEGIAQVYGMPLHRNLDEVAPDRFANGLANARLIAAAPEMLEALEMVMQHGRIDDSEDRLNTVASAIAKARGEYA